MCDKMHRFNVTADIGLHSTGLSTRKAVEKLADETMQS